jgi:hypothetical protein
MCFLLLANPILVPDIEEPIVSRSDDRVHHEHHRQEGNLKGFFFLLFLLKLVLLALCGWTVFLLRLLLLLD